MGGPVMRSAAVVIGLAVTLVAGCSSSEDAAESVPTRDPATAAVAPAVTTTPAGVVTPLAESVEAMVIAPGTSVVAALVDDGQQLLLIDGAGADPREVALPTAAATVSPGPDGTVLAPAAGVVAQVDTTTGTVTEVPVDGEALSAAVLPDGRWAVGTSNGTVLIVAPETGDVESTIRGLVSVDALTVTDDTVAALDRHQTSITELDLEDSNLRIALRAGDGATQMTSDPFGRVLVTDTDGDELLVHTLDSLVLRQRYPVGPAPYAVAYDEKRDLVWVTLTGSNEVVGYDLSTGIPRERHRFATVRQPNSLAVDPADAALVVASATGDGLQRIPVEG
ncbi:NHL repeat-containing protein [Rhodococcus artemisiae]|uniref:Streptogramin lyase n=1 Tax=Rhodococcus artemisiae TaxID=714159 RepID=A0ABU7L3G0_9NOCA|nr:hypothetical protein [Rhodococcus artemisiae]MEE2056089.1 hypothetical protein [Rhodococcus artemisiae]